MSKVKCELQLDFDVFFTKDGLEVCFSGPDEDTFDRYPVTFNNLIDCELDYNAVPGRKCLDKAVYDQLETLFHKASCHVRTRREEAFGVTEE